MKVLLYKTRLNFMFWLYNWSQSLYVLHFKRKDKGWSVKAEDLKVFKKGSLGWSLYYLLKKNNFDLMPKLEAQNICHILTGTGTEIENEIAMQYLLLGNGKRSLYMMAMICIGTIGFPEYIKLFKAKYLQGKEYLHLSNRNYETYLTQDLKTLKQQLKRN